MLSQSEEEFVEFVLEVGNRVLEQDTFEFISEEGLPVDEFVGLWSENNLDEVVQNLEEKGLAYTESQKEIIRTTNLPDEGIDKENLEHKDFNTDFKTVDRRYIYFTEEMESLYKE